MTKPLKPTYRTSLTISEDAQRDVKEFQRLEGVLKESEAMRRLLQDGLDLYFGRKAMDAREQKGKKG